MNFLFLLSGCLHRNRQLDDLVNHLKKELQHFKDAAKYA